MNDKTELDRAWKELELTALASDGRISDADVRQAIRLHRDSIERQVMLAHHKTHGAHMHDRYDCQHCDSLYQDGWERGWQEGEDYAYDNR